MAFKKFNLKNVRSTKPSIAIWTAGILNFNKPAIQKYNIMEFNHVVLYYDEETIRIGLELYKEPTDGCMKLSFSKGYVKIAAKNFFNTNNIDFKKPRALELYLDEETGFLAANL